MRCDNGAVVTSLPKAFTSPGLDFTSPGVDKTSPGVVITSPGLVFTSPGADFTSRRFRKTNRRLVRAISLPKPKKSMLPFHTRAFIRIPSPGKSTHVFTRKMFLPDYHRIQCEGLRFQVFTRAAEWLWRVENTSFTQKRPLKLRKKQHSRPGCCEHLKAQAFTLETPDNQ